VSGGTENHLFLVDLSGKGITGAEAERVLEQSGIMVNKNLIPFDARGANTASGIRIGTPAVTTRGMREGEMEAVADMIDTVLQDRETRRSTAQSWGVSKDCAGSFPFYAPVFSV